jgi:CheY-like chemotaxis protein
MVVDDNPEVREMLRRALEQEGCTVIEAENGRAALDALEEAAPSLILLDLMMPVMDGFEFVMEAREQEAFRSIPIVVVTAKDITDEDRQRLSGGVVGLIEKRGFGRDELLGQIRSLRSAGARVYSGCAPGASARDRMGDPMAKILLVEDQEMNRDMLTRRLVKRGYEVEIAVDGAEGVDKARNGSPDLILMDMSLPVMDGWEATRRLKADEATRGIPVVALTAHAMSTDREKALEAGCDAYETKPVELPRLLETMQKLLDSQAAG